MSSAQHRVPNKLPNKILKNSTYSVSYKYYNGVSRACLRYGTITIIRYPDAVKGSASEASSFSRDEEQTTPLQQRRAMYRTQSRPAFLQENTGNVVEST